MSKVNVTIDFQSFKALIKASTDEAIKDGLRAIGMESVTDAQNLTPVKTGRLKNSIAYAVSGEQPSLGSYRGGKQKRTYTDDSGEFQSTYTGKVPGVHKGESITLYLGTNVEYAEPVEEGREGRAGAHMLRDGLGANAERKADILKAKLKAALEDAKTQSP